MKKLGLLLTIAVALPLCACEGGERKAEDMISSTREATMYSNGANGSAKNTDDILSEDNQKSVESFYEFFNSDATDQDSDSGEKSIFNTGGGDSLMTSACFAGTDIIQPEYIIDVEVESVDDSRMKGWYMLGSNGDDRGGGYATYYFSDIFEAQTAFEQYKEYIDSRFYLDDVWFGYQYRYINDQGDLVFYIDHKQNTKDFILSLNQSLIDYDKIDIDILGNDPSAPLSIRNTDQVLKR